MPNISFNTITPIGLTEQLEIFIKDLSKAMFAIDLDNLDPKQWGESDNVGDKTWYDRLTREYCQNSHARFCILYPHTPYERLEVVAPRCYVETKWRPPIEEIRNASKVFPSLTFHLGWWLEQDGPTGEFVVRNGRDIDQLVRPSSWYLFDCDLRWPTISLLPAHLPYTLAQRAVLRVEDAIETIKGLNRLLDDGRFLDSPYTPFSECRDQKKTENLRSGLTALSESMVDQARQLDFQGVFLDEKEFMQKYPSVLESDKSFVEALGLEPLMPEKGKAVRFSLLPFGVALTRDPDRMVCPVLLYKNADPVSGKYKNNSDGSMPKIEWEIRYACLRRLEVRQISKLPDEGQTPLDIDLIMTNDIDRGFGRQIVRAYRQARWRLEAEIAKQIRQKADAMSKTFATKVTGTAGMTIFENFDAAAVALFPNSTYGQTSGPTA